MRVSTACCWMATLLMPADAGTMAAPPLQRGANLHRQLIFDDLFREFDSAILEIFEDSFPEDESNLILLDEALDLVDTIAVNVLEAVGDEATRLVSTGGRNEMTSREIQTSVRLRFPGELAKQAVSTGTKAVTINDPDIVAVSVEKVQLALSDEFPATVGAGLYLGAVLDLVTRLILEAAGAKAIELGVSSISTDIVEDGIAESEDC